MGYNPIRKWVATHYRPVMKIRENWRDLLIAIVGVRERAPISKAAGLSPTYLRDVIERNQTPQMKSAEKLTKALRVPISDWYLEPDELSVPPSDTPVPNAAFPKEPLTKPDIILGEMSRDVPILGAGSCGEDGMFELNGQVHDHAKRPPRLVGVKDAYALWVMGTSMEKWRRNGELVYVHPHQPVNVGDYVVVQLKPENAGGNIPVYIKELVRRTTRDLRLRQYNPAEEISIPTAKVASIHRIVDWSELMGI